MSTLRVVVPEGAVGLARLMMSLGAKVAVVTRPVVQLEPEKEVSMRPFQVRTWFVIRPGVV